MVSGCFTYSDGATNQLKLWFLAALFKVKTQLSCRQYGQQWAAWNEVTQQMLQLQTEVPSYDLYRIQTRKLAKLLSH